MRGPTPLLLKIAPDVSLGDLDDIVGVARRRKVDGMIVGNTTLSRPPSLRERETAMETGRVVGKPLFALVDADAGREPMCGWRCRCR